MKEHKEALATTGAPLVLYRYGHHAARSTGPIFFDVFFVCFCVIALVALARGAETGTRADQGPESGGRFPIGGKYTGQD